MAGKLRVTAKICGHCGNLDDLEPFVRISKVTGEKTLESRRCPCPHDQVTSQARTRDVQRRHRAAVALARENARFRAQRDRSAS